MQAIKVDIIFFDFDGTIANTLPAIFKAANFSLEKNGFPTKSEEEIKAQIGNPVHTVFRNLLQVEDKELIEKVVQDYRKLHTELLVKEIKPYPGVKETLQELQAKGKKLVIVSVKPLSNIKLFLKENKIIALFTDFFCNVIKPYTEEFTKEEIIAQAKEQFPGKQIVMVGDTAHDILGAKKNGLKAIGVTFGAGKRKDLEEAGAEIILDEFSQLAEAIE